MFKYSGRMEHLGALHSVLSICDQHPRLAANHGSQSGVALLEAQPGDAVEERLDELEDGGVPDVAESTSEGSGVVGAERGSRSFASSEGGAPVGALVHVQEAGVGAG